MERCAGPAQDDSYTDLRSDYQQNEPAVDYNSGFTGVKRHKLHCPVVAASHLAVRAL